MREYGTALADEAMDADAAEEENNPVVVILEAFRLPGGSSAPILRSSIDQAG